MKFKDLAMETERGGVGSQRVLSGLPSSEPDTPRPGFDSGFTMVEIAICLAVIGFALVAIIGVLPTGMQVQRENREETLINQDGAYFMEAIRSGARGIEELPNYVMEIKVVEDSPSGPTTNEVPCPEKVISGTNIIGALSTPWGWPPIPDCLPLDQNRRVYRTQAKVRSISGAAAEKGDTNTITFEYILTSEITPFRTIDPALQPDVLAFLTNYPQLNLQRNLYEVRLTFRWPLLINGTVGNGRKVFRSMISGNFDTNEMGYFFDGGSYARSGTNAPFGP
jgi:prepilin-type N-terminal cleavage/methylation domain-containing protein